MTGKYPARLHITDWIAGHDRPFAKLKPPDWTQHLPLEEVTIAEVFKSAGYATAHIGKWHLGDEEFWPTKQGFDVNIGGNHRGQPPSYFFPYERNDIKLPGLNIGHADEYLTDRLTEEAKQVHYRQQEQAILPLPAALHSAYSAAGQGGPGREVRSEIEAGRTTEKCRPTRR